MNQDAAAGAKHPAPRIKVLDGELVAKSTGTSPIAKGARIFHLKFGNGTVAAVDGNKLTVDFDKAGRKMVLDSFVQSV
jgi:DNA helicase II / ATP-dependent DNA helicase PcrA